MKAALLATQKALSPISPDGHVAKSIVTFVGSGDGADVPTETATAIITAVKAANGTDGLQVGANGQVLSFAGQEPPSSEAIGVLVALVILLIAFGSVLAAGLPLLTAIIGVGLGGTLLLFVARFVDVATFAPTLAAMIGLGVGIDYSLFVINRFRQAIHAGHDAEAGRARGGQHLRSRGRLRRVDGRHRAARPVRDAHRLLQRSRAGGVGHGAARHARGGLAAAGAALAARRPRRLAGLAVRGHAVCAPGRLRLGARSA